MSKIDNNCQADNYSISQQFLEVNNTIQEFSLTTVKGGEVNCNCPIVSDDGIWLRRIYLESNHTYDSSLNWSVNQ